MRFLIGLEGRTEMKGMRIEKNRKDLKIKPDTWKVN
jgi:hypothetical protein